jgi:hypothetical protein
MRHQPFETWVFEQDSLSPDQTRDLRDHLATCDHCNRLMLSWNEVEKSMVAVSDVMPKAGFTERWKVRLAEYRQQRHQIQLGAHLLATTVGLTALTVLLGAELINVFQPALPTVLAWMGKVANLLANINLMRMIFNVLLQSFVETIPVFYWLFILLGFAGLSILWLVSLNRYSYVRIKKEE